MEYAASPGAPGVQFEYQQALYDQQASAREYGNPVRVRLRSEASVSRDAYGSIKSRAAGERVLEFNAASISYQPSERAVEKAGLRDRCDAVAYTAMQDWIDAGLSFDDVDPTRMTVTVLPSPFEANGTDYDVRSKGRAVQFGNGYLCVTLALARR